MTIRLVTFDALHTLVTPRLPIYNQYSQTFAPYLGVLEPGLLKQSFKVGMSTITFCQTSSWAQVPQRCHRYKKKTPHIRGILALKDGGLK